MAAYRFKNMDVFTPSGQSGKVTNVLVGDDGQSYAVIDFGRDLGRHQVPISSLAYEGNQFVVHTQDVRALPSFVEGQKGMRLAEPATALNIQGYRMLDDDSSIVVENADPRVTVQRPALQISWEQAAPQVTVQQPTPQVNVRQLQPVIIVRQPPPRITVELDQPEIIVRMPDPEVSVTLPEPNVQVSVPKPSVQVLQAEQPQVKISAAEPKISLLPGHAADVAIEKSQADVRFERLGEPQIVVRSVNGAPRVKFEEIGKEEAVRVAAKTTPSLQVAQLQGRKIFNAEGDEIGSVHRVLSDRKGNLALIVATRGILGFSARKILLPITNFGVRDDRLLLRNLSAAEVGKMDAWDENMELYTPALADRSIHFDRAL